MQVWNGRSHTYLSILTKNERATKAYEDKVLNVDRRKDCIEVEFRTKAKERW